MCRLAWRWRWLACSSCTRSHGLCTSREMSTRAVPLVSEHWTSRPDILYSLYPRLEYIPLEPILIKKKHLFGHVSPPNCMKNFRERKFCTHFLFLAPISGANNAVYHTTHYLRLVSMSWIYYPWTHFNLKKSFWACFPPNCMKNFREWKFCTYFLFLAPIFGANNAVYHTTHYLRLLHWLQKSISWGKTQCSSLQVSGDVM